MHHKAAEYDYEAPSYDESRFYSRLGRHLDYMHKTIVGSLLNSDGKMVLDAGVGSGRFAIWLAEKDFEVVGVDSSKEMLNKAKGKAQTLSKNIHLVLGDIHFLPFRKGVFDSCICINVINHIPEMDGFLKEVKHAIEPRGLFIVNFPNLQSPYLPIAIIVNLGKQALMKGGKIRSRWFTPLEIKSLMRNAGFNIKEVKACTIASPIPFGDKLVKILERVNLLMVDSKLKFIGGSLFIRAEKVGLP